MSRFAAIEARATQYPASVNDVVWLVEQVRELRVHLTLLDELRDYDCPVCGQWNSKGGHKDDCSLGRALDEPDTPGTPRPDPGIWLEGEK